MRPLELTLRNFRSYFGGEQSFDFRGRSLVGVVGPIGSGKSSLLDAISFALYGKTSTAGANTKALIHQRASDGGVMLRFEVEGDVWEAVRSLRRKGASQHALYRYEADDPAAEPVERFTLEGDVNDKIAGLLGLDYDAFGRSVLLAQGRFAEFLRSRPSERDAVLKGVFGHDRIDAMREIAKQYSATLTSDLGKITVRTEQLERVAGRLAHTRETLAAADDRVEALRKIEPQLDDLAARIMAATTRFDRATTRLDELKPHAARLPAAGVTEALIAQAAASTEERAKLAAALEAAQADVGAADEALAGADAAGERKRIDEAAGLRAAAEPQRRAAQEAGMRLSAAGRRLDDTVAKHDEMVQRTIEAERAMEEAGAALVEAAAVAAAAEARLHEVEHANMAASLRRELGSGDACPVCLQKVAAVPALGESADVSGAQTAVAAARKARAAAESQRTQATAAVSGAVSERDALSKAIAAVRTEVAQLESDLEDAEAQVRGTTERLVTLLGEGDPADLIEEARRGYAGLGARVAEARRIAEHVRGRHDAIILEEQEAAKRIGTLRVEIADLAARLDTPIVVASEDAAVIGRAAEALRKAWETETAAHLAAQREAADLRVAAEEERAATLREAGVDGEFAAVLAAADATVQHLREREAEDAAEIDAAEELFAEQARLEDERGRYDRLVTDLTNARFVRFLLDDERTRLGHLGSDHFQRLSSGRYRFTEDGTFSIVDLTAADATRKAASLSGGETFLASLALALSLAEMVTRTGGRLDAFFLDEGFGSLDPEHLDLAMDGIEALISEHATRLVVVVSHVPEMRERIEDLIVLDRDPLTGDTKVLQR